MTEALLEVSNLRKEFGGVRALDDVSLSVGRGEVVCIIGPSGCGKSTFLRCISYLTEPTEGFVRIGGSYLGFERLPSGRARRQSARAVDRMRPKLGFVFQQFNLWPHLTVAENIARGPIVVRRIAREQARAEAIALLERFGLADKADAFPSELSGGQKQRVAIARALAMQPELILLDEPTSALDPEMVGEVLRVMKELAVMGMTMLVVTHEIGFAASVADRIVFMEKGKVVEEGPAQTVLNNPSDQRVAAFLKLVGRGQQDSANNVEERADGQ